MHSAGISRDLGMQRIMRISPCREAARLPSSAHPLPKLKKMQSRPVGIFTARAATRISLSTDGYFINPILTRDTKEQAFVPYGTAEFGKLNESPHPRAVLIGMYLRARKSW